jgi:hypothetical protein
MPAGLLMGAMIVGDSTSATILLSIVFAVALTKKIDNIAFKLGVASLLVIPIVYRHMVAVQWLPLIILTAAGVVDELGNDIGDWIRKRRAVAETLRKPHKDPLSIPQTLEEVLFNRGAMKLTILALAVAGTFPPIYLIAFLAFDATYVLAEKTAAIDLKNRLHISGNGRTHKPKEKQITLQT